MAYPTVAEASVPQLGYLRSAGQWSKLYLAVFKPATVYTARLLAVPSSTDRVVSVTWNSGAGTLANVKAGMSMYVGSTAGASDLGLVRIRKTPISGTFYIGETSEVDWQATCYLTVVNDHDLWAKHINTVSDTDFRMDYDVTYTNQNSVFEPVPIMGGHRVVKLTGSSVATLWNFSNSWVIGSTISSFSVACATASSITNGTTSTPTINFNTAGWHAVYLTIGAANSKTYVGVRYVYVYSAASVPATVFQLGSCSVDYETGGWSFDVTVQAGIELENVPDRALCILFAEDYYNGTKTSIGQLAGCENVICTGRIAAEQITLNPEASEVTLTIQGAHYWMGKINAFPTGVIASGAPPTNWAEMQNPTVQKVVHRLLHWGCTATSIMDVYITSDTRIATELTAPSSNLWMQIQEIAFTSIFARPGVDRYGRFFVEVEPQVVPDADRTWPVVMTLTDKDWQGSVAIERVVVTPTGRIDLSGIVATSSDDGDAFFSLSPGHVFKRYGGIEVIDRLLLSTQILSNQLAGLVSGWRNNPYPNIEMDLNQNNRMIDCFPRQYVGWSVGAEDTPRGFELSGTFVPRRVQIRWDANTGFCETSISIEYASVEDLNVNGDIPGVDAPPSLPPLPPFSPPPPYPPIIVPGEVPSTAVMKAVVKNTVAGLLFCENFNELVGANTRWRQINAGLSSDSGQDLYFGAIDKILRVGGSLYVAYRNLTGFGPNPFIAYAPAPGSTFVAIETPTTIAIKHPGGVSKGVNAVGSNPLTGQVAYVISTEGSTGFYLGTGATFVKTADITSFGIGSAGSLSFGEGKWRLTAYTDSIQCRLWIFSAAGALETSFSLVDGGTNGGQKHMPISTTNAIYTFPWDSVTNDVRRVLNDGTNTPVGDSKVTPTQDYHLATDPSGMYVMTVWDTGKRGKSTDGLASVTGITGLPFEGDYSFDYIGGLTTGSHWAACAGRVYYSKDGGVFWGDQSGDIHQIAPTGGFISIEAWF